MIEVHHVYPILADHEPRCRPRQECQLQWGCMRKNAAIPEQNAIITDYSSSFKLGEICSHFVPVPRDEDAP